jgi:polyhydroxyalkanoate synthesis regulator phasin
LARDLPIVRSDFPSSRRGWDPDAVRAHLEQVEALVAELRAASTRGAPAAETASAQVREIIAAAEHGAEAIRAGAEQDARRIREAAADEADSAREAARAVGERARELERQLAELAGVLRAGVAQAPPAHPTSEPAPPAPEPAPAPRPAVPPPAAGGAERTDEEAARLVALDLALSGRSRDEVDRHLAEHYDLPDRNSVLQDVFSIIEG